MNFGDLVKAVLEMPPGSIVFAKRTKSDDELAFEIEDINGKKPAEA